MLASLGLAAFLLVSAPALAANAPPLGTAAGYAALGPNAVTCTTSTINGDVGTQAPSITDTSCTHNGTWNVGLPGQITADISAAKNAIDSQPCTETLTGTLAGLTRPPGVYCFTAAAALTGLLTLSGPSNGIWVFRIGTGGSADLTATDFTVQMAGGGQACNVYWKSSQDATVTRGSFLGTILSGRDLTFTGIATTGSPYGGRLLATRSLTMTDIQPMTFEGCGAEAGSITIAKTAVGGNDTFGYTASPALGTSFNIATSGGTGSHVTTGLSANTYTVTESTVPTGWTQTGPASCTDSSTAGSTFSYSGAQATINLQPGGIVTCTYTNTLSSGSAMPTVTVTKVSNGGVGSFSFTGNNGFVSQTITTATSGVGVAGAPQTLTAAHLNTIIAESPPPAGFTLDTINCTGGGLGGESGATATTNIGTRSVTLNAAATAVGAAIACTFTNTYVPVAATAIPTLSEWAMIVLATLMAITGFVAMRRKEM